MHESKKTSSSNSRKNFCLAFAKKKKKKEETKQNNPQTYLFSNKISPSVETLATVIPSEGSDDYENKVRRNMIPSTLGGLK